jgi:hypothetical protein
MDRWQDPPEVTAFAASYRLQAGQIRTAVVEGLTHSGVEEGARELVARSIHEFLSKEAMHYKIL